MTLRKLTPALLSAGKLFWDKRITLTGQSCYLQEVLTHQEDRWGNDAVSSYGSKEPIYLIVQWDQARLHLAIVDMSEEEDEGIEAFARFKDDIREGALIEIDVYDVENEGKTTQRYKVTKVKSRVHQQPFSKRIWLVPYRSDTQTY